jgi:hypothetical protein
MRPADYAADESIAAMLEQGHWDGEAWRAGSRPTSPSVLSDTAKHFLEEVSRFADLHFSKVLFATPLCPDIRLAFMNFANACHV